MTLLALSFLFVLVALYEAGGQESPKVLIGERPADEIEITHYSESQDTVFAAFLDKVPPLAEQKPFALIMSNHGSKAVVAMTMRWVFLKDGEESVQNTSTDSFRFGARPVAGPIVEAHGRLLVAPQMFLPESTVQREGGGGIGGGRGNAVAMARQSDSIRAHVAAVIFEDGEVIGPEGDELVKSLKARKAAAEEVAAAIAAARKAGKSDAEIVWELGAVRPSVGDSNEMLKFSMMRQLSMSRDLDRDVEQLKGLPLPAFTRGRRIKNAEDAEGAEEHPHATRIE